MGETWDIQYMLLVTGNNKLVLSVAAEGGAHEEGLITKNTMHSLQKKNKLKTE